MIPPFPDQNRESKLKTGGVHVFNWHPWDPCFAPKNDPRKDLFSGFDCFGQLLRPWIASLIAMNDDG